MLLVFFLVLVSVVSSNSKMFQLVNRFPTNSSEENEVDGKYRPVLPVKFIEGKYRIEVDGNPNITCCVNGKCYADCKFGDADPGFLVPVNGSSNQSLPNIQRRNDQVMSPGESSAALMQSQMMPAPPGAELPPNGMMPSYNMMSSQSMMHPSQMMHPLQMMPPSPMMPNLSPMMPQSALMPPSSPMMASHHMMPPTPMMQPPPAPMWLPQPMMPYSQPMMPPHPILIPYPVPIMMGELLYQPIIHDHPPIAEMDSENDDDSEAKPPKNEDMEYDEESVVINK